MSWKNLSAVALIIAVIFLPGFPSTSLSVSTLDSYLLVRKLQSNCATPDGYYNGSRDGGVYNIGAFSLDKADNFVKCKDNPLLIISPGEWDSRHVKDPYVIRREGQYYLYYTGSDGVHGYKIGLATSSDGLHFKKYVDNPIIRTGTQETNSYGSDFPVVYIDSLGLWHMLFSSTYQIGSGGISHATSIDGLDWKLDEANQVLKLPSVSLLIAGDIDNGIFYFGSRESGKDSVRSATLEDLEVSDLKWKYPPCSLTPRGVKGDSMALTVYGCVSGIREMSAFATKKNGEWSIDKLGILGLPEPGNLRWDAISAENITWVRDYD